MQFVGLLLIVNSLAGGAWWVASGRPQAVVLPICVATMAAGVFLIVHDRSVGADRKTSPSAEVGGLDELARQTAEAKKVLADLQDQTAAADWHLKQLDEHIQGTRILPDGRTRIGNTVAGQPSLLIAKLEELQKLSANRSEDVLPLAKRCVEMFESTREQTKDVTLATGEIGTDAAAWLYMTASTAAQQAGDHDQALVWARAAVGTAPTAERRFLLVTALMNKGLQAEADRVIIQELKSAGGDAARFRQLLDQYKVPYKPGN